MCIRSGRAAPLAAGSGCALPLRRRRARRLLCAGGCGPIARQPPRRVAGGAPGVRGARRAARAAPRAAAPPLRTRRLGAASGSKLGPPRGGGMSLCALIELVRDIYLVHAAGSLRTCGYAPVDHCPRSVDCKSLASRPDVMTTRGQWRRIDFQHGFRPSNRGLALRVRPRERWGRARRACARPRRGAHRARRRARLPAPQSARASWRCGWPPGARLPTSCPSSQGSTPPSPTCCRAARSA